MVLEQLTDRERDIILGCLRVILEGPYISGDGELHSRIGLWREELQDVVHRWPGLDDSDSEAPVTVAIYGCLIEVLYGIYIEPADWDRWIGVPKQEVKAVQERWTELRELAYERRQLQQES